MCNSSWQVAKGDAPRNLYSPGDKGRGRRQPVGGRVEAQGVWVVVLMCVLGAEEAMRFNKGISTCARGCLLLWVRHGEDGEAGSRP